MATSSRSQQPKENAFPLVTKNVRASILYSKEGPKLDSIAAALLAEDIERVTSFKPQLTTDLSQAKDNVIVLGNVQSALLQKFIGKQSRLYKNLAGKWECYGFTTVNKPTANVSKALVIAGSDTRGTAYGVFTLSEKIGVSPWWWWADVPVKKQSELILAQGDFISTPPAVKFRGIFINDEDWGLQPWAAKSFETETGDIGPKTYAKVFELLLRLKANLIWPAMHPSTKAFFHYPGNAKIAEAYGIVIGSSHAEPMLRNNVSEWDEKTMGHFNYLTNKQTVYNYWEERVKESSGINSMYTIGMRGVHDSQMEGVKTAKEAVPLLEQIFRDQRNLLAKYVNKDLSTVPQVFTAYKEVLDIYDNGLKLPDDVTLVWPDDNYGYILRLNTEKEKARKGGAGVYYHASYWGRPHDYLWLPSVHPSLMREEMMKAYETGANRLWVLNVGDIKPQEYNIQEFLDMAYDPAPFQKSEYPKQHILQWTTKTFGKEQGQKIGTTLWDYYNLAFQRKPEFMGWSQTEPTTQTTYTTFNHFYYGDEAQKRIDKYNALEAAVKELRTQIPSNLADAFYQLVYYPVIGASLLNKKFLYRDKAWFYGKQNRLSAFDYAQRSKDLYDSIVKETTYYNTELADGKWKYVMSMNPRNLPVYQPPVLPAIHIDSTSGWSVAPEGYVTKDSSLTGATGSFSLPLFDNVNKQRYFVDIFLQKNELIKWTASVSRNWIRLSKDNGALTPVFGNKETRLWVDIDWRKFPNVANASGQLVFKAGNEERIVSVQAQKLDTPELSAFNGFVENNGYVSIHAADFSRQSGNTKNYNWHKIENIGYAGNAVQVLPLTITPNSTADTAMLANNACLEYDFYTFTAAPAQVIIFTLPTHPLNNNYGMRYAVSVDKSLAKTVDFKTVGRSEEWKQNVLANRAQRRVAFPLLAPGKHTLKIYAVDPGVMLDEIRIDLGGLKKAYGELAETK